jgi:Transposase DDE domain
MYDKCSDEEAVERTKYDDRWKVALDLKPGERPFAKSTLQEFRAKLLLHEAAEKVFIGVSLSAARKFNKFKGPVKVVLDTTPIVGRGAVKDTYHLVADGIKNLARILSHCADEKLATIIERHSLSRYFSDQSLKGGAGIDWTNDKERREFLNVLVTDAKYLISAARSQLEQVSEKRRAPLTQAIQLLEKLILQDTEPDPSDSNSVQISRGTAKDRIVSTTDPDIRHGRKSSSKRFDGHKLAVVTEPESKLIAAVGVIPGNAPDNTDSLHLVEKAETNLQQDVEKAIGDCAYGDGNNRREFEDDGRTLVAKVPAPPSGEPFHKAHFKIDLENGCVTCPAGKTSREFEYVKYSATGEPVKKFFWALNVCQDCPHKEQCLASKEKTGARTVTLHPQEDLLQKAREYQKTEEFKKDMRDRQEAEHRFARMMQHGMRQARYFGRAKVLLQGIMTAAMLNLVIVMGFATHPSTVEEAILVGQLECPSAPLPNDTCSQSRDLTPGLPPDRPDSHDNPTLADGARGAPQPPPPSQRDPK